MMTHRILGQDLCRCPPAFHLTHGSFLVTPCYAALIQ